MNPQAVIDQAQIWAGEQNTGQRWTDAQWLRAVDRAQKTLVRELKWPPGRFVFMTLPGVQEYQLQEVIKIFQVYLNGQIVDVTTIATMEGQQIQVQDQSGSLGGPGGLVQANTAPTLAGGQMSPAWSSQGPAAYPVLNDNIGGPAPTLSPWANTQRPRCYIEGGNLGFVPAPIAAYPCVCRVVKQPATLTNAANDVMVLPDISLDAMAWDVCEQFFYSDKDNPGSADSRNYARDRRTEAMVACKDWRKTYGGDGPTGPVVTTMRGAYRRGQRRVGAGGW